MDIDSWLAHLPTAAADRRRQTGRPLVTLSYAQTLNGAIAIARGHPLTISSPDAMRLTHRLRAGHQAILVGIGTVLSDNPRLTTRLVDGPNPQPVILDTQWRFPPDAALWTNPRRPWIAGAANADRTSQTALQTKGARLLPLPVDDQHRVSLPALLQRLAESHINSLMVEGGVRVITAFLAAGLVDYLLLTVSPVFVNGLAVLDGAPLTAGAELSRFRLQAIEQYGQDVVLLAEPSS